MTTTEMEIMQTVDFFSSIEAPHLKEGTVRKMFTSLNYQTAEEAISEMIMLNELDWGMQIGEAEG